MTSSIRFGMDSIVLLINSTNSSDSIVAVTRLQNSSYFSDLISWAMASSFSFVRTTWKKFSIGLRSGERAGMFCMIHLSLVQATFATFEFCRGSPSCNHSEFLIPFPHRANVSEKRIPKVLVVGIMLMLILCRHFYQIYFVFNIVQDMCWIWQKNYKFDLFISCMIWYLGAGLILIQRSFFFQLQILSHHLQVIGSRFFTERSFKFKGF